MRRVTATNSKLISDVFQQTRHDVYAVFRRSCIPEEQCWDMTQDVFVKLMAIDLLDAKRIKGMVFTIAYRMRTDYFRHRAFLSQIFTDKNDLHESDILYNSCSLEVKELQGIEMRVVGTMSDTDRKVYCMGRMEEKSSREIAMELNLTCRAVENRLYRTRKVVRETIRKAIGF